MEVCTAFCTFFTCAAHAVCNTVYDIVLRLGSSLEYWTNRFLHLLYLCCIRCLYYVTVNMYVQVFFTFILIDYGRIRATYDVLCQKVVGLLV